MKKDKEIKEFNISKISHISLVVVGVLIIVKGLQVYNNALNIKPKTLTIYMVVTGLLLITFSSTTYLLLRTIKEMSTTIKNIEKRLMD